VPLHQHDFTAG